MSNLVFGPDDPMTLTAHANLAAAYRAAGRDAEVLNPSEEG